MRRVLVVGGAVVINRRNLLIGSSLGLPLGSLVRAQRAPRTIGLLSPYTPIQAEPYGAVFEQAMRDLGYVVGKDYVAIPRFAEGSYARLPDLANELVMLKVDVIVTSSTAGAAAAHRATASIPIVFESVADPVRSGFAESLAHPGGNMTGLSNFTGDLTAKRFELLKQMVPGLIEVSLLANPDNSFCPGMLEQAQSRVNQLGLHLTLAAPVRWSRSNSAFAP
jgi:putative ABC transport system substrate-binding protein